MRKILIFAFLLPGLILAGCGGSVPTAMDAAGASGAGGEAIMREDAFRNAMPSEDNYRVFYEIFVGSFSDSNGDGVGDLRGVIRRMDYLNDGDPASGASLGVEGIWLSPIFSSESYHKYDVNDYYSIDPDFGSMDDLKELIALCHERNVKLILDLPINHTGASHPWFSDFCAAHRSGDSDAPYYGWYSFCSGDETPPAGHAYASIPGTDEFYECNFSEAMPELNYDNPSVREAMLELARFYLDLGIDGFRFDAAKYIYYGNNEESEAFWQWYMDELRKDYPEMYAVAEVWDSDGVTDVYYPALNCFDFTTSQANGLIAGTAKKGNVNAYTAYVESYLNTVRALRSNAMIVPFIANHDTDRAAGYLPVSTGQMQMAANLYLLSSGSPFIYYGEEIGMKGSRGSANTDANRRLAMLWGDGDTVTDPEGATYPADKQVQSTVAQQLADSESLLSYYKRLILIRQANPEICRGEYHALSFSNTKLGGFMAAWQGSTVCVLHNTTEEPATVDLAAVCDVSFSELSAVIGQGGAALEGSMLTLDAMTSAVLR